MKFWMKHAGQRICYKWVFRSVLKELWFLKAQDKDSQCVKINVLSLLCSYWFTGLITQPETGTPASNCLTEQSLLWTLDKPLAVSSGRKKRLPLSCDRFPQVCDCYLLLSVIGSTYRICLLSALICLLCELAAPPCATEDLETLESLRIVLPRWKSSVSLTAPRKGFPPITLLASYKTRRILKGRRSRA